MEELLGSAGLACRRMLSRRWYMATSARSLRCKFPGNEMKDGKAMVSEQNEARRDTPVAVSAGQVSRRCGSFRSGYFRSCQAFFRRGHSRLLRQTTKNSVACVSDVIIRRLRRDRLPSLRPTVDRWAFAPLGLLFVGYSSSPLHPSQTRRTKKQITRIESDVLKKTEQHPLCLSNFPSQPSARQISQTPHTHNFCELSPLPPHISPLSRSLTFSQSVQLYKILSLRSITPDEFWQPSVDGVPSTKVLRNDGGGFVNVSQGGLRPPGSAA